MKKILLSIIFVGVQIIFAVPVNVILKISDKDVATIENKQQHLKNILSAKQGCTDIHISLPPLGMHPKTGLARKLFDDTKIQFGSNVKTVIGVGKIDITKGLQFNVQHLTDKAAKIANEPVKKPHVTLLGPIDIPQAQVAVFAAIVNKAIASTNINQPIKVQFNRLGIVSVFPALFGHEIGKNNLDTITQKILKDLATSQFKQNLIAAQAGKAFHSYNSKDPNALHVSLGTFSFMDTGWRVANNWKKLTHPQQLALTKIVRNELSQILKLPFANFVTNFKMPVGQINLCESIVSYMDTNGQYQIPANGTFNLCTANNQSLLLKYATALQQFKIAQITKKAAMVKKLSPLVNNIKKALIKIPVNIKNTQGQTPLMLDPRISPIVYGLEKMKAKITVNAKDAKGKTVIQYLITSPFYEKIYIYRALISAGAKVTNNDIKAAQNKLKNKPNIKNQVIKLLKMGV